MPVQCKTSSRHGAITASTSDGVAATIIEKIDLIRCMKRFSLLAVGGYVAGALVYIAQYQILG
jgi:hypothetical protein